MNDELFQQCLQEAQDTYGKLSKEATMDNIYKISIIMANLTEAMDLLVATQMRMIYEITCEKKKGENP